MLMVGCASELPRLDADFGTSYKLAKANQVLDPDAGSNLEPVTGLSASVVEKVTDKYTRGFEKAQEVPTYTFNIGTGK